MLLQGAEEYNTVTFPHCTSDARKSGHVAVAMDSSCLKLHACDSEGKMEVGLWEGKEGGRVTVNMIKVHWPQYTQPIP